MKLVRFHLPVEPAIVRLSGSRGYGYHHAWSDSDFYVCGDGDVADSYWHGTNHQWWACGTRSLLDSAVRGWVPAIDLLFMKEDQLLFANDTGRTLIEHRGVFASRVAAEALRLAMCHAAGLMWGGEIHDDDVWMITDSGIAQVKKECLESGYCGKLLVWAVVMSLRATGISTGEIDASPHRRLMRDIRERRLSRKEAEGVFREFYAALLNAQSRLPVYPDWRGIAKIRKD